MQTAEADDLPLPAALLQSPPFLMIQMLRAGRRLAEASPEGPRLPHMAILATLVEFGPQSQRDLGRRLGFDPSDVVGFIDDLEADGQAERRRDPEDRRRNAVAVTRAGRVWLDERLASHRERLHRFLGGLDEDERDQLLRLLQRALAHHDGRVPEAYRTV